MVVLQVSVPIVIGVLAYYGPEMVRQGTEALASRVRERIREALRFDGMRRR
jgi:hypothetical protein